MESQKGIIGKDITKLVSLKELEEEVKSKVKDVLFPKLVNDEQKRTLFLAYKMGKTELLGIPTKRYIEDSGIAKRDGDSYKIITKKDKPDSQHAALLEKLKRMPGSEMGYVVEAFGKSSQQPFWFEGSRCDKEFYMIVLACEPRFSYYAKQAQHTEVDGYLSKLSKGEQDTRLKLESFENRIEAIESQLVGAVLRSSGLMNDLNKKRKDSESILASTVGNPDASQTIVEIVQDLTVFAREAASGTLSPTAKERAKYILETYGKLNSRQIDSVMLYDPRGSANTDERGWLALRDFLSGTLKIELSDDPGDALVFESRAIITPSVKNETNRMLDETTQVLKKKMLNKEDVNYLLERGWVVDWHSNQLTPPKGVSGTVGKKQLEFYFTLPDVCIRRAAFFREMREMAGVEPERKPEIKTYSVRENTSFSQFREAVLTQVADPARAEALSIFSRAGGVQTYLIKMYLSAFLRSTFREVARTFNRCSVDTTYFDVLGICTEPIATKIVNKLKLDPSWKLLTDDRKHVADDDLVTECVATVVSAMLPVDHKKELEATAEFVAQLNGHCLVAAVIECNKGMGSNDKFVFDSVVSNKESLAEAELDNDLEKDLIRIITRMDSKTTLLLRDEITQPTEMPNSIDKFPGATKAMIQIVMGQYLIVSELLNLSTEYSRSAQQMGIEEEAQSTATVPANSGEAPALLWLKSPFSGLVTTAAEQRHSEGTEKLKINPLFAVFFIIVYSIAADNTLRKKARKDIANSFGLLDRNKQDTMRARPSQISSARKQVFKILCTLCRGETSFDGNLDPIFQCILSNARAFLQLGQLSLAILVTYAVKAPEEANCRLVKLAWRRVIESVPIELTAFANAAACAEPTELAKFLFRAESTPMAVAITPPHDTGKDGFLYLKTYVMKGPMLNTRTIESIAEACKKDDQLSASLTAFNF